MQRWKSSVLLILCVSGLLIGCVALYLHGERSKSPEKGGDLPLHPISSPSYIPTNSQPVTNQPQNRNLEHHYVHRYDALKGVFRSHFKTPKPSEQQESSENNSSRLKRQLDFGSDEESEKKNGSTNPKVSPTNQPVLKVLRIAGGLQTSSPPPPSTSSDKSEGANEGRKFGKNARRFRPSFKSSSDEKYNIPEGDRKNFTLEVVQVERKVVRSEDGSAPRVFGVGKGKVKFVESGVATSNNRPRPSVVYKTNSREDSKWKPSARPHVPESSTEVSSIESDYDEDKGDKDREEKRVVINLNEQIPISDEDISDEDLKDYHDGHSTFGTKGNFTHVISRNVAGFLPNNQVQSGNQGLYKRKSNSSPSPSTKGRGREKQIVIEKGKVGKYQPGNSPFEDPSSEIYAVPGGRSGEVFNHDDSPPKQQVYHYTRNSNENSKKETGKNGKNANDLTSPAIPSSLEELYRKGHPGVLPAPKKSSKRRQQELEEPFEDHQGYRNPFRLNPLVDDVPLKFDPESDRFYGEPIPDTKEKVAQSNSPIRAEDRNDDSSRDIEYQDYFSPKPSAKRGRSTEDDTPSSAEPPAPPTKRPSGFDYGRAYNPPEYSGNDYDTEQGGDSNNNDPEYDFVGLDDNFGRNAGIDDDYYDYGGGNGGRGSSRGSGGGSTYKSRSGPTRTPEGRDSTHEDGDDGADHETSPKERAEQEPVKERRPQPTRDHDQDVEYDDNAGREAREGSFGFGPEGRESADEPYDSGFINTLKQFDEEIRKLQEQERNKLLHPSEQQPPVQSQIENTGGQGGNARYSKEPPLIITSPGPPVPVYNPDSTTRRNNHDVSSTMRVADDEISHSHSQNSHHPETTESLESSRAADDTDSGQNRDYDDSGSGSTENLPKRSESGEENISSSTEGENPGNRRNLYDIK